MDGHSPASRHEADDVVVGHGRAAFGDAHEHIALAFHMDASAGCGGFAFGRIRAQQLLLGEIAFGGFFFGGIAFVLAHQPIDDGLPRELPPIHSHEQVVHILKT